MAVYGKKKVFADAVLAGSTNKEAAIKAGYSAATASAAGSRLVKDKEVAAYLEKQRAAAETTEPVAQDGPKFDLAAAMTHTDPKIFLTAAMNDIELDPKQRIIAAKALMPFVHGKVADQCKKEDAADKAKVAAAGKYGVRPGPRLVASK